MLPKSLVLADLAFSYLVSAISDCLESAAFHCQGETKVAGSLLGSLVIHVLVELWPQSSPLAEEEQLSACRVICICSLGCPCGTAHLWGLQLCSWRSFSLVQELNVFGLRPREMAQTSLASVLIHVPWTHSKHFACFSLQNG